jgi:hypothetical protein
LLLEPLGVRLPSGQSLVQEVTPGSVKLVPSKVSLVEGFPGFAKIRHSLMHRFRSALTLTLLIALQNRMSICGQVRHFLHVVQQATDLGI